MASITYLLIGSKPTKKIYCRLIVKRGEVYQTNTGYSIGKSDWSANKKSPKTTTGELKNLKLKLELLKTNIESRYNEVERPEEVNAKWLKKQVANKGIKESRKKIFYLDEAFNVYLNNPPIKKTTSKPRSRGTILKYRTIQKKIYSFQKCNNKRYLVKDVDASFRDDFYNYLTKVEKLSNNTAGRYISFIKTVCIDARIRGAETSSQLEVVTGTYEKAYKIFLSFDEIAKINSTVYRSDYLENAKDWLVIGCYIGQRVSDLLILTEDNISHKNDLDIIELTQKKTGKTVFIPIEEPVRGILAKRGGKFPRKISSPNFNLYIKEVAKLAGITEEVEGSKINPKTKRKEVGMYPKYELVTSHICRRSFATNFYGNMITSLIIQITGHSTEKMFLEYVDKPPIDNALKIAEYFSNVYKGQVAQRNQKEL